MKKSSALFTVIILVYILFRLLLVSSQRDEIFDSNELFSGTLAIELIRGLSLPLKYCMPDNHNFGSIINGILIVPFYLVFGPSSASAKMVSILFSLGVLVFSYLLLNRFFNRRAAAITSLLFIFSPTIYTKSSVLSIGSHPESNLFSVAMIFIFYLVFFGHKKSNRSFILLGLISGFACFYSYICGITLLVLLIFWFAFDRKSFLKPQFYLFFLFFIIGFSPRLYFASGTKHAFKYGIDFLQFSFSLQESSFSHNILKAKIFLLKDLPQLFNFEHDPPFIQYIYYSFFLMSLLYYLSRSIKSIIPFKNRKRGMVKESLLLAFPFIFSLAYILSRYAIWGTWQCAGYLVPLYPFIFIIIAISFEHTLCRENNGFLKALSSVLLGLILLAGFYENLALISFQKIGRGFMWKGYFYRFFGEQVGSQNFNNEKFLELIRKIDLSKRQYFLEGWGWKVALSNLLKKGEHISPEDAIKKFHFSEQEKLYYYRGLGRGLAHELDLYLYHKRSLKPTFNSASDLGIIRTVIGENELNIRQYFWEGFGQEIDLSSETYKLIKDYVDDQCKLHFYKGIGETRGFRSLDEDYQIGHLANFEYIEPRYIKDAYLSYRQTRSEMLLKDVYSKRLQ